MAYPKRREPSPDVDKLRDIASRFPELAKIIEPALEGFDDTDSSEVLKCLPAPILLEMRAHLERARTVVAKADAARQASCLIETIVLCHGMTLLALRILGVCATQRSTESPMNEEALRPLLSSETTRGELKGLVDQLRARQILEPEQASFLLWLNENRNRAVHGVIFGEIGEAELSDVALKSVHAASGAIKRAQAWMNNPVRFGWKTALVKEKTRALMIREGLLRKRRSKAGQQTSATDDDVKP